MGEIKGHWLEEAQKVEIVMMIEWAKEKGVSVSPACSFFKICRDRVDRWRKKLKEGSDLRNRTPGPENPLHRLLPSEREVVLDIARREEYADLAHRTLAVMAWDLNLLFLSFSSVYRILRAENLIGMRGTQHHHSGRSLPPVRKKITGPNQRWSWDISYLRTCEKSIYLYLYLLLDGYSRKAIHWLVSWHQTAEEARIPS